MKIDFSLYFLTEFPHYTRALLKGEQGREKTQEKMKS